MKYKQLDLEQRYRIEAYLKAGLDKASIAREVGVHRSTIYRELGRNVGKRGMHAGVYRGGPANSRARARHHGKNKSKKFTDALKQQAKKWLENERWSPELIAVEWQRMGVDGVGHETIYQWIWHCKKSNRKEDVPYGKLYLYLRHGRAKKKRGNHRDNRGTIPNRVPICKRPGVVDNRQRIGDIEVDLMLGKRNGPPLLVMTDRATLVTKIDLLPSKNAGLVADTITDRILKIGSPWIKTMTFDNGLEFAKHEKIAKACGVKTYFTRPYTSQDKGTVENRIGLIRRWLPKGCDLSTIHIEQIKKIEAYINNRRVRKFGYLSPIEKLKSTWPVALIT